MTNEEQAGNEERLREAVRLAVLELDGHEWPGLYEAIERHRAALRSGAEVAALQGDDHSVFCPDTEHVHRFGSEVAAAQDPEQIAQAYVAGYTASYNLGPYSSGDAQSTWRSAREYAAKVVAKPDGA